MARRSPGRKLCTARLNGHKNAVIPTGMHATNSSPNSVSNASFPAVAASRQLTVHQQFLKTALASPRSVALVSGEEQVRYSELLIWAHGYAARLQAAGVERGSLVALDARRSTSTIAAMLGILFAGGAYVPVDVASCEAPELLRRHGINFLALCEPLNQDFEQVRTVVLDSSFRKGALMPHGLAGERCTSEDPVYVMFTSGSTGNPKGVVVPHRAVQRLVIDQTFMKFGSSERFLLHSPLHFDASTLEVWGALLQGGAMVIAPDRKLAVEDFQPLVEGNKVTSLWLTAGLFHLVAEHAIETFAGLRHLLVGGDVISPASFGRVARRYPNLVLINGYGPTENTTFTACYTAPPNVALDQSVPIGTPIAGTEVHILDEAGQPVPDGSTGQLAAGGAGVALGYLKQPELTARKFVPDTFSQRPGARMYLTGDRVRRRADGQIEFLGRIDSEVKLSGHRVLIEEVEQILRSCPAVAQCVVVAREGDERGRYLAAFVQWRDEAGSEPQLREFVSGRLPALATPRTIQIVQNFPLNVNGKVDRSRLLTSLEEVAANTATANSSPVVEASVESSAKGAGAKDAGQKDAVAEEIPDIAGAVEAIWQRLLQRDWIPEGENFFDLGGDSLSLIAMQAELRKLTPHAPTVMQLFSLPSVQSIADHIGNAAKSGPGAGPEPAGAAPFSSSPLPLRHSTATAYSAGTAAGMATK